MFAGTNVTYKNVTMDSKSKSFNSSTSYDTTNTFEIQVIFPVTNTVVFSKKYNYNGEVI